MSNQPENDLPDGTILRYDASKSSHGVTLSIEQFIEWEVLVPVEPDRCLHVADCQNTTMCPSVLGVGGETR